MDEKLSEILEQFDIDIKSTYRGRGGTICITEDGTKILKEFHSSAGKLADEYELKKNLIEEGFGLVDQHIKNKQGTFFAEDRYHTVYIMKGFFEGRECDIRSMVDVKIAGKNLACFHQATSKIPVSDRAKKQYQSIPFLLEKRNRELKRAKNYMEDAPRKGDFEHLFLKAYPLFFRQAAKALDIAKQQEESKFYKRNGICHGEYNQHNIIKTEQGIATINLEHFCYQNQLLDLHQFLRKTLEKNRYQKAFARQVLEGYVQVQPLEQNDYECLYHLLLYPDKFFKIANHYNSSRKAFISPKDMEKLSDTIEQNRKKEEFLVWYQKEFL